MGAILKNNVIESLEPRMVRFNLSDVRAEAAAIVSRAHDELDQARAEARAIVEQARAEAEQLRAQAHEQGFQTGRAEGIEDGRSAGRAEALAQAQQEFAQENAQLRAALAAVLDAFETERNHLLAQAHQDLLALALAIAVKVTRRQLDVDPGIAVENVKSAVGLVGSRSVVELRMNPADVDRFELLDAEQARKLLNLRNVTVLKDEGVEPGGCILHTQNGQVDAQVATQLDNLVRQIAPAMAATVDAWTRSGDATA